ncbi:MAG: aminotransferase class V-fold PLP-dependent enzyme [Microbacteriaceae bacterium]|nr:aminotransferase class V-fold PLP-dependent enzyme [Microbacteriaceae bacterium]
MLSIEDYAARFDEEPGYLDFARFGPVGAAVVEEEAALLPLLARARFGSLDAVLGPAPHDRVRAAVAALTGFSPPHIVFQPNTSQGLMHVMFGITGGVAYSPAEFPSVTFAARRAQQALGVLEPVPLTTESGRVSPGGILDQGLPPSVVAVALSLVDFRTGYLADLEGIRQVIGDRLLVVDATQGFGVVDAPYALADVVVAGGQKWPRAGWGTGFLALSDRALEHLTPVWSGFNATDVEGTPMDEVPEPTRGPAKFQVSNPDPVAQARLAAALEELARVGVPAVNARMAERVAQIIDLADEFAIPVTSPRAPAERAGIVVLEPEPDRLTVLSASLHNHGVAATTRAGHLRLSAHASTGIETLDMLRAAFLAYRSAAS